MQMRKVLVLVEGQTEEAFIKRVLGPALWSRQVAITPVVLKKGVGPKYYSFRVLGVFRG